MGTPAPTSASYTSNFANSMDGWSCGGLTTCGSFGQICGGYNTKAAGHSIEKTLALSTGQTYNVNLDFIKIDSWDNENAYIDINGVRKYTKNMAYNFGTQQCGQGHANWNEARVPVVINNVPTDSSGNLKIKVYTSLSQGGTDESFGIDNVKVTDVSGLSNNNGGCHAISSRAACMSAKDGRKGQFYSDSPCSWCCGKACTGNNANKCEPHVWVTGISTYHGESENGAGHNTCK